MNVVSKDIKEKVENLVQMYLDNPQYEIEGYLCNQNPSNLVSGVNFVHFKGLYDMIANTVKHNSTRWYTKHQKDHFARFFFKGDIRGCYSISRDPIFVRKILIDRVDIKIHNNPSIIRISLKEEVLIENYIPKSPPVSVRLYERWSFVYDNIWLYDLSKVVQGSTKESACKEVPTYEVEIELTNLHNPTYRKSAEYLTLRFIHRLIDLLGVPHNRITLELL